MVQTALIIGASRGLGLGLANEYLRRGWSVIATSRGPSALDELRGAAGERLVVESLDITDEAALPAFVQRLAGRSLDLAFVNAGILVAKETPIAAVSTEDFTRIMVTNTLAPMRLVEALAPLVTPSGAIAVMSSGLGSVGNNTSGGWEIYRASKAALNMAMRSYAVRHEGATLLVMAPGWVRTDMGGAGASLDVETSVRGMAETIAAWSGKGGHAYVDYKGGTVGW